MRRFLIPSVLVVCALAAVVISGRRGPLPAPQPPASVGALEAHEQKLDPTSGQQKRLADFRVVSFHVTARGAELPSVLSIENSSGAEVVKALARSSDHSTGTFTMSLRLNDEVVKIDTPGFKPESVQCPAAVDNCELVLLAYASLKIRHTDYPPVGVKLSVEGPQGNRLVSANLSASTVIEELAQGNQEISVSLPSGESLRLLSVFASWGDRLDVDLRDSGAISVLRGTVTQTDGQALPAVEVTAQSMEAEYDPGGANYIAQTNAEGSFCMLVSASQDLRLSAHHQAYRQSQDVVVSVSGQEVVHVSIQMHPAREIHGEVLSPEDLAISRVRVTVKGLAKVTPVSFTDDDGRFRIPEAKADSPIALLFEKKGWASAMISVPPMSGSVTVVLLPERSVLLRVVDALTRVPVPNAQLSATVTGSNLDGVRHSFLLGATETRAGTWSVSGASMRERIFVTCHAAGFDPVRCEVEPNFSGTMVIEVTQINGVDVRGRIFDSKGPLEGAMIRSLGGDPPSFRNAFSDKKGKFVLRGLQPGEGYWVEGIARSRKAATGRVTFVVSEGVFLELKAVNTGMLRGTLELADSSDAFVGGAIQVDSFVPDENGAAQTVPSGLQSIDKAGPFRVGPLVPGLYTLSIVSVSHGTAELRDIRIREGESVHVGTIQMSRLAVLQLGGTPGGLEAVAFALAEDGTGYPFLKWQSCTGWTAHVPEGNYSILVSEFGFGLRLAGRVNVSRSRGLVLSPGIAQSGFVRVQVLRGETSMPQPGVLIEVCADAQPPLDEILVGRTPAALPWFGTPWKSIVLKQEWTTDAQGYTTLGPFSAGKYTIKASGEEQVVRVEAGTTVPLVVRVK